MYSINTIKELTFIGAPILLDDFFVYPLTVKDKIKLESQYTHSLSLLCMDKAELDQILSFKGIESQIDISQFSPFDYLLTSADINEDFLLELKSSFATFIREEITISPQLGKIFIGQIGDNRYIDKDNFENFQTILRIQNHLKEPEKIPENENYMQRKFRLRRKQLEEAKAKQAQKNKEAPHFVDLMSSLCVMNVGITWQNIKDLPIFTFYELLGRSQEKEKYDTDVRAILAGADSKKIKLKYWIRDNSVDE